MAKQPVERGLWDGWAGGGLRGIIGTGRRFGHEGEVEDSLLPDGIPSTGATSEPVTLALRHYNIGALHGSQLSGVGGVSRRWRLQHRRDKRELNFQRELCDRGALFYIKGTWNHSARFSDAQM